MKMRCILFILSLLFLISHCDPIPNSAVRLDYEAARAKDSENADKALINQEKAQIEILKKERKADLDIASAAQKNQLGTLQKSAEESAEAKQDDAMKSTLLQEINLVRIRIKNIEAEIDRNRLFLKSLYDKRRANEVQLVDLSRSLGVNKEKLKNVQQGIKRVDVVDVLVSEPESEELRKRKLEVELGKTIDEQEQTVKSMRETIKADREREISQEQKIELLLKQLSEAKVRLATLESRAHSEKVQARELRNNAKSDAELAIQEQATVSKDINAAQALRVQETELQQKRADLKRDAAEKDIEYNRDRKLAGKIQADAEKNKMNRQLERQKEKRQESRALQREIELDKKIAEASA